MASQMDLHNLSSLADKRDMANPLHSDEYLFQVTFAVVSCESFYRIYNFKKQYILNSHTVKDCF